MAGGVEDRDLGYARVMRDLADLAGRPREVVVGVRAESGAELATIAAVHEFGSEDGDTPERSYLRSTIDENREAYVGELGRGVGRILDGTSDVDRELARLGQKVVGDVQQRMADGIGPPLDPETVRRKGSSTPLIDTGRLRQSIDSEVR